MTPIVVARDEAGQTLAALLRKRLSITWSAAKQLIADKKVRVGGQPCLDVARRLIAGQRVELTHSKKHLAPRTRGGPVLSISKTPEGLIVRHADADVVVVEKPPGLTTMRHDTEAAEFGARGKKYLPKTLADHLGRLLNDGLPLIAVHRIDKDTSGLVVFARNPKAAQHLGKQFRNHSIERTYQAIVRGVPKNGRMESWLVRDRGDGRRGSGTAGVGERAVTHVKVIRKLGELSLVECRLETGRTHQIRIHLGESGCPLAGERIYDRPINGRPLPDPSKARRILLHATSLGFDHPSIKKIMRWQVPLPPDMNSIIAGLGENV